MAARVRTRAVPLALALLALVLAVLQRPGWSSSDTKIDLHTDPVRFLGEIAHLWTPSSGLGGVESAQYAGYLFPMGPFFAIGHWLGMGDWLVDRLWLGLLLAVGAWGMVRVVEELGVARTWVGSTAAGLVYLLNPYVVVFTNRTTITLLAYALMPWLVLVARRGLRAPTRWRAPAVFALLVTASGGGVNAAVVAFTLVAPLVLVLIEPLLGVVDWRDVWRFVWRALAATFVASLWWVAPTAAQAAYGVDFLRFTEPAGAIWATTSLSESFRMMGYWISYIGVGFNGVVRPYFSDAGTMLFNHLVVSASLLVPGLALFGFAWTRKRRYAAYFLVLVLLGTLVMAIGFPEGTPLRRGATFAYNHFPSVRFLRTTYKAGPLVAFGVAGLAALGIEAVGARRRLLAVAAGCVLVALSAWPLVTGRAVDRQVSWKHIPAGWTAAARDLDRSLGDDARAAVLPGQLYAFYRWGGTVDPILPSLTDKPVAVRNAVPYGDLRGTDLLWTTDSLLQQGRLLPGQLPSLLDLMSVRKVVAATDDDIHRSGVVDPERALAEIRASGLRPGPVFSPSVRSFRTPRARPLVRLEPRRGTAVVDGNAEGLAALSTFAGLPERDAFGYAADLTPAEIRSAAQSGGTISITDSNRRRISVVSRLQQNAGWTLGASDPISEDAATLDPFPERGSDAQTVAVLHGARSITAPFSPGYSQFPEHRPYAAFDGDPRTAWLADRALDPARHTITITFDLPRDVNAIDLLPRNEAGARTSAVVVNGRRSAVGSGWAHLRLGLHQVQALTIKVVGAHTGSAAAGGLAEVRVPGVHVTESLRPPVLAEHALAGLDLSRATLDYAFTRASGDDPRQRTSSAGVRVGRFVSDPAELEHMRVVGAGDEEVGIDRLIDPPASRTYDILAWLSATPEAPDSAIDKLVGARGGLTADSSGRFEGRPGFRASSAVDGDPRTAWVSPWQGAGASGSAASASAAPWIRIRSPRPVFIRTLELQPPPRGIRRPTRVLLTWPGGHAQTTLLHGRLGIPRDTSAKTFTIRVLAATGGGAAVGIGEIRARGLAPLDIPRSGAIAGCSALGVRAQDGAVGLRVGSNIRDLDAGRPLLARSCNKLAVGSGTQRIEAPPRTLRPDALFLTSPAPSPIARTAAAAGAVTDPGNPGRGARDNVRLSVRRPAWLVLGESYDRGWRATCNGRALGKPVPLDGYANAWPVDPGCTKASFSFAPQKPVTWLQIISGLACLILLAIALQLPARLRRARGNEQALTHAERANRGCLAPLSRQIEVPGTPVLRSVVTGILVGAVLAFCFSLRSGVLIAPAVAAVLWLGIGAAPLAVVGGLLLAVVVPLEYLLWPAPDFGGYNPGFAGDQVGGHWIAVAAWVLLALAAWRTLSTARSRRRGEEGEAVDASA